MYYKGKLYGKSRGRYFELEETSEDVDKLKERIKELEALVSKNESLHDVSTRFVIANITISDIVKGKKYELIEKESMGYYIIDDTGEETYYNHSVLDVC